MSNVIEFRRPKPKAKPLAPKIAEAKNRAEWKAAVMAVWSDPSAWRTSKKDNRYIVIGDLGVCLVIKRVEEGWSWEIRWRYGKEPVSSNWVYVAEKSAFDEALEAVIVLA